LEEILTAAREMPEIDFFITGNKKRARLEVLALASANTHFTDFLPQRSYYGLLGAADAVMCLTTRDNTMQRGACEALSLGKPIITSDTQLLRDYFDRGTVHVSNRREGIREGILKLKASYVRYQTEIEELRRERRNEWNEKKRILEGMIREAIAIPEGESENVNRTVRIPRGIQGKAVK
jgi:glycosyltransferase involved in cell wall biosynthesis